MGTKRELRFLAAAEIENARVRPVGGLAKQSRDELVRRIVRDVAEGDSVDLIRTVVSPRETSYLRFDFEDATVELTHLYGYSNADWRWTPAPHVDAGVALGWTPPTDGAGSHAAQLAALVACLRAGVRPPASGADGRRALELITGIYAAAATDREVRREELTPDHEFYGSMAGSIDGEARNARAARRP